MRLPTLSPRMLKQCASAWLVTVSGFIVGHAAAQGMNEAQWAAAAVAILGSITLAAVAHGKPPAVRERG